MVIVTLMPAFASAQTLRYARHDRKLPVSSSFVACRTRGPAQLHRTRRVGLVPMPFTQAQLLAALDEALGI